MFCKECGTLLENEESKFCGKCGAKVVRVEAEEADGEHGYCAYCGVALAEEAKHCVKCGGNVEQREEGKSGGFCEKCGTELFGFPTPGSLAGTLRMGGGAVGTMLGGAMAMLGKDPKELGSLAGIAGSKAGIRSFCPKCGAKVGQVS